MSKNMKNIKARFKYFLEREDGKNVSRYIILAKAVLYQKSLKEDLVKCFKKLVPKNSYLKSRENEMIDYLEVLTNRDQFIEEEIGIYFDEFYQFFEELRYIKNTQKRAKIAPYGDEF